MVDWTAIVEPHWPLSGATGTASDTVAQPIPLQDFACGRDQRSPGASRFAYLRRASNRALISLAATQPSIVRPLGRLLANR